MQSFLYAVNLFFESLHGELTPSILLLFCFVSKGFVFCFVKNNETNLAFFGVGLYIHNDLTLVTTRNFTQTIVG